MSFLPLGSSETLTKNPVASDRMCLTFQCTLRLLAQTLISIYSNEKNRILCNALTFDLGGVVRSTN